MELTNDEKQLLSILFSTFSNFTHLLESKDCYIETWGDVRIDRDILFNLAEKLGVEYD